MLHPLTLPSETRKWLSCLVRAQLGVLEAVLHLPSCNSANFGQCLRDNLPGLLARQPYFHCNASGVTQWVLNKDALVSHLKTFATHDDQTMAEKRWLVQAMKHDIWLLYTSKRQGLLKVYLDPEHPLPAKLASAEAHRQCYNALPSSERRRSENSPFPLWLEAAKKFLLYFYDNLDDTQRAIFPDHRNQRTTNYTRQEFFEAFTRSNPYQYVCPVCDNSGYRTVSSAGQYYGDIEHYLPKSIYPHLCVHPFNLVPVCKLCNEAIKGDQDPFRAELEGGDRYKLSDLFLPYHPEAVLGRRAIVRVRWSDKASDQGLPDKDYVLRRRRDGTEERIRLKSAYLDLEARPVGIDLSTHFKLFSRIYDIPGRWEALIDEICDALFRRIRQVFADDLVTDPDVLKSTAYIKNKLDWLLTFIDEFQGSTNYAYPAKWWLTQLIIDYVDNNVDSQTNPLLREIESWKALGHEFGRNFGEHAQKIKDYYLGLEL